MGPKNWVFASKNSPPLPKLESVLRSPGFWKPWEAYLPIPKGGGNNFRRGEKGRFKNCELFWIDGYKVLIGRNSKENREVLKMAKANDIWMHVRGIPSSHLIIKTDKQRLPKDVIAKAGKLCVDFSIKRAGDYEVDYCKRRFVKIQEGSNVEYDKYQTITVRKDGIEMSSSKKAT